MKTQGQSKPKQSKKARKPITKESQDRRTMAWRRHTTRTIWYGIISRCTDPTHPAYEAYGGRGIKMHEAWIPRLPERTPAQAFLNFVRDVGLRPNQKLSLDRKDPNGGYEPLNVKWATDVEQARNKRKSVYLPDPKDPSKLIPAAELADRLGLRYQTLRYRYQRMNKWPPDMVIIETEVTTTTIEVLEEDKDK